MLFRRKIEKSCAYCRYATKLEDQRILCARKGIREDTGSCFRFKYDPLKRVPSKMKALDFSKYDEEDYSL